MPRPVRGFLLLQTKNCPALPVGQTFALFFGRLRRAARLQLACRSGDRCWLRYGDGAQTAATGDTYLPAKTIDYFTVTPGQTFAFLSTSTSSGFC